MVAAVRPAKHRRSRFLLRISLRKSFISDELSRTRISRTNSLLVLKSKA